MCDHLSEVKQHVIIDIVEVKVRCSSEERAATFEKTRFNFFCTIRVSVPKELIITGTLPKRFTINKPNHSYVDKIFFLRKRQLKFYLIEL